MHMYTNVGVGVAWCRVWGVLRSHSLCGLYIGVLHVYIYAYVHVYLYVHVHVCICACACMYMEAWRVA